MEPFPGGEGALADGEAQLEHRLVERLEQVVVGPGLERGAHPLGGGVLGEDQDVGARALGEGADPLADLEGAGFVVLEVEEGELKGGVGDGAQRLGAAVARRDAVLAAGEEVLQLPLCRSIRDHQCLHRYEFRRLSGAQARG